MFLDIMCICVIKYTCSQQQKKFKKILSYTAYFNYIQIISKNYIYFRTAHYGNIGLR